MNEEHKPVITDREELYDKCENMEQLFDKYYLPLLDKHFSKTYKLQQENQQLKEKINGIMEERDYLFNKLSIENKYLQQENQQLKERIDKAIEYVMTELITEWDIKNDGYVSGSDLPADAITPLLDILKGEDNNE